MGLSLANKIAGIHTSLGPGAARTAWEGIEIWCDPNLAGFSTTSGYIGISTSGEYIKTWSHSTLTQPTQSQLDAVT